MNRIILIGNGFDLAHGLKTSYKNFIDDFWDKRRKLFNRSYTYEDDAIKIYASRFYSSYNSPPNVNGYDWLKKLVEMNKSKNSSEKDLIIMEHKNAFLKTISEKSGLENWVDIEEEYYRALNECLSDNSGKNVEKLNNEFLLIKTELENYLKIQQSSNVTKSENIERSIFSKLKPNNFIKKIANEQLDKILFLSFNYTNTEAQYIQNDSRVSDIIHIHGELDNPNNPIIFGYGDEIGSEYKIIEAKNDNKYLEYIKSIKYIETNNHRRLLNFIKSGDFEIFIMGHSCGRSDRVLLNMLFEDSRCMSIKVFYHKRDDGSDDYSYVVRNMSRHFTNKIYMRNIVVDKTDSEPLL
jgi:hypothetical protein